MTTLHARTPEDLLAFVPVALGFHPADSVVLLTFGSPTPFHARLDLPPAELADRAGVIDQLVDQLVEPAVRHGVRLVVLLLYSRHSACTTTTAAALHQGFRSAGIDVAQVISADGTTWRVLDRCGVAEGVGVPYDVSAHPFVVESVVGGAVTHASRADLAASIGSDPAAGARVSARLGHPASAGEAVSLVEAHARGGTVPTDAELAGVLVALLDHPVRDAAWLVAGRETADSFVRLWVDAVRRAPPGLDGSPLVLLAASAWLAGHGALAWCALDRLFEVDPDHCLGRLVATLLEAAVPPSFMDSLRGDLACADLPGDAQPD